MKKQTIFGLAALCLSSAFAAEPDSANYRQALESYENWQYDDALYYLIEANKEYPKNGYIFYNLSKVMFMADDAQTSLSLATQAVDLFGPDDKEGLAKTYLQLGFLSTYASTYGLDTEEPIVYYDKAVEVCPENPKTWLERGVYLDLDKNDLDKAREDYRRSISLDPEEVEGYTRLADSYVRQKDYDGAIAVYKESIKNVKDYPYHHDELAEILIYVKEDYDLAAEVLLASFDMADEFVFGAYSLGSFPEAHKQYLREELTKRKKANPDKEYWQEYLDELDRKD